MDNEIKKISEHFGRKTILLPKESDADCYAIYSKEEYENPEEKLLVDGKAYKHRLYLYKKNNTSQSKRILTFITLNPGYSNHSVQDEFIDSCIKLADNKYGAIEIFSIFTLRTIDTIDAVSEDAILDVFRADLSKNDIVLAYGDEIIPTEKYKDISSDDLVKINKVRSIKINELLDFIMNIKSDITVYKLTADSELKEIKRR